MDSMMAKFDLHKQSVDDRVPSCICNACSSNSTNTSTLTSPYVYTAKTEQAVVVVSISIQPLNICFQIKTCVSFLIGYAAS